MLSPLSLLDVGELGCEVNTVLIAFANDIPPGMLHTTGNVLVALSVPILVPPKTSD